MNTSVDIFKKASNDAEAIDRIQTLLARLRAPDGCPWDREQKLADLRVPLVEESYELLEVMDGENLGKHREELGDVLLQVLFQAQLRRDENSFDFTDVVNTLCEKLIRRHPHVFGDVVAKDSDQVLKNWEAIKRNEGEGDKPRGALDGVPAALPALLRAQRVQSKAARSGFDWKDKGGPDEKISEELGELRAAIASGSAAEIESEVGDLLFSIVNLCRFLDVDAENALRGTIDRFSKRFRHVEARATESGKAIKDFPPEKLDDWWNEAKNC